MALFVHRAVWESLAWLADAAKRFAVVMFVCTTAALVRSQAGTFTNPVVASGADPWVIERGGSYYYCRASNGAILVSKTASLPDIGRALPVTVWTAPSGTPYSRNVWAPELHYLRGRWYIYFAADDGRNENHRMYALEGDASDPQLTFQFKGKVAAADDHWAIDGTVLQMPAGELYFIWSGWEGLENGAQNIYIAPMSDPWTVNGPRVCLSRPKLDWESHGRPLVNEGPEVLWSGRRLFIIYSASASWGDDYCLGQLAFHGGSILDSSAWSKKNTAVFSKNSHVQGPGHCSFVKSPDGQEDWIIYHAAKHAGSGWDRNIRMQKFGWNIDGSPDFGTPVKTGVPLSTPSEGTREKAPR